MDNRLNKIKVVLAEQGRTNKWLAEKIGRDPATVSKWCTNTTQPPLDAFVAIAKCLDVKMEELIRETEIENKK
ncbi:MAG: helix-turn-helix domain-containing protein [Bacteroidales bacterium]|nr:helix-turn-helix domain-containing protein [Bacteroidales bacterium]